MKEELRIRKWTGAILLIALILSSSLVGCRNGKFDPNSPVVTSIESQLEQEAWQLLQDYIHSHLGASKTGGNAQAAVVAQLKSRHPDVKIGQIRAAVSAAARK